MKMYVSRDGRVRTVQLTRNLNTSVEYERFYSRVSMCKTRALVLVLELHSKIGPLALEHSCARTHTQTLQYSYSTQALQYSHSNARLLAL